MEIDERGRYVVVPVAKRFWSKVRKTKHCWIWMGAQNGLGYGLIWDCHHNKRLRAHRVAWELANRKSIPNGKSILHSCDNPRCVNPSHLRIGTDADNHQDMIAHGRALIGSRNPRSRFTEIQIRTILRIYPRASRRGPRNSKELAIIHKICRKYCISMKYLARLANGDRWKHISNSGP